MGYGFNGTTEYKTVVCNISLWQKNPCLKKECPYHGCHMPHSQSGVEYNTKNYPKENECPYGKKWMQNPEDKNKISERNKITEKQAKLIKELEQDYKEFKGRTKQDAIKYINEAIAYYRKRDKEEGWIQECMHENAGDRP